MTEYSYPDVCYSTEYINLTLQLHHGHGKLGWWQLWDKRKPRLYEPECEENKKTLNDTLQLLLFNDRAPFGFLSFITGFGWVLLFPHLSCTTCGKWTTYDVTSLPVVIYPLPGLIRFELIRLYLLLLQLHDTTSPDMNL